MTTPTIALLLTAALTLTPSPIPSLADPDGLPWTSWTDLARQGQAWGGIGQCEGLGHVIAISASNGRHDEGFRLWTLWSRQQEPGRWAAVELRGRWAQPHRVLRGHSEGDRIVTDHVRPWRPSDRDACAILAEEP